MTRTDRFETATTLLQLQVVSDREALRAERAEILAAAKQASESLAAPAGHPLTAAHVNGCAACQQTARAVAQQDRAAEGR